ncbi:Tyrosine recombinase XerD [Actinomyces bovis]|uniref:Tyrosine recombinase XerD n=1 Tax=Actinomyces bovis TaxID=1658 RepID=A0ABY1VN11_9ACTO|nr:tyrosine-type recombinase/integrase [Actinomyces bovis]SPT53490.1 Tyrosine recombinase XerD [Actinomyces bovis]VEG55393.1 Tyrosine recombinase XerD [Actinomyces israelii]
MRHHIPETPTALLDVWTLDMQAQGLAGRTITERRRVVAQLAATTGADLQALTPGVLTAWLAGLPSPATKGAYHAVVRAWSRWLVRSGRRTDDPTLLVPHPRTPTWLPRPVTSEQLAAVLALPLRRDTEAKIILGAYAGMRVHEIAKIRGQDIDHVAATITITGKGGTTATLPAHPRVMELARAYPRSGYWFPSPTRSGRHVTPKAVGDVIVSAFTRAGTPATAHQLRHHFATELLRTGTDSRVVQTLMRHASLSTTARYLAVDQDQQRTAPHSTGSKSQEKGWTPPPLW